MSSNSAISIEPQTDVIRVVVNQPQLNDTAIDKLFAEVSSAAAQHAGLPVVLDLTAVNYVPSMALGTLVMLMRQLKNSNQRFVLVGLQAEVRTVLAITRLDKLFEIQPNYDAALRHLHVPSAAKGQ
jgi:anti-anti-sigma factor